MPDVQTKLLVSNGDEVRLIAILDPHLAHSAPESWKADYRLTMTTALEQILEFGKKMNVCAVVWAGDLFHRKAASRNPTGFLQECVRLLNKAGCPNVGIAGNHDLKWGSLEGLEGQPLGLLVEAGIFRLLDQEELLIDCHSPIHGEFTVRIAGASYEHGKAEACRDKKKQGANWLVSVGHFWFGKEDGVFNGEPLFSPQYLGTGEPDIYIIGHKHDDQGVVRENGKVYVVPGALTLLGEKSGDATRRPAAAYITITKTEIQVRILRPKMPPYEELINMEQRQQLLEEERELEAFVNTLTNVSAAGADPTEILNQMEVAEEVKRKVLYYLDEAKRV